MSRTAPSIWGVLLCLRWGTWDKGMVLGGANQESVWDVRVSSSRTDTSIIHLEFPAIRPSRGPRTAGGVNDGTDALRPADLLLSVERPERQCCSLDDRESPVMFFLTRWVICPNRPLWRLPQMRAERPTWVGAGGCVGVREHARDTGSWGNFVLSISSPSIPFTAQLGAGSGCCRALLQSEDLEHFPATNTYHSQISPEAWGSVLQSRSITYRRVRCCQGV